MKCPDRDFTMLFRSMPLKSAELQWEVHLVFPANMGPAGALPFYVTDWDEVPIPEGHLDLMGGRWKFAGGRGKIPCADFIKGIHETAVWLHRTGMDPVSGGLTFG